MRKRRVPVYARAGCPYSCLVTPASCLPPLYPRRDPFARLQDLPVVVVDRPEAHLDLRRADLEVFVPDLSRDSALIQIVGSSSVVPMPSRNCACENSAGSSVNATPRNSISSLW